MAPTTASARESKKPGDVQSYNDRDENTTDDRDSVSSEYIKGNDTSSAKNEEKPNENKLSEEVVSEAEPGEEAAETVLAGTVDANGNVVDGNGNILGKVTGDVPQGSMVDTEGDVVDSEGNIIGKAEPIDNTSEDDAQPSTENIAESRTDVLENADDTPDGVKTSSNNMEDVVDNRTKSADDESIDGDDESNTVDDDKETEQPEKDSQNADEVKEIEEGLDAGEKKEGNEEDLGEEAQLDFSLVKGLKANKLGKIVNEKGVPVGHVVDGDVKKLAGKTVDEEGKIWDDGGNVIGRAEPLPYEKQDAAPSGPFEDFPDSVVDAKGDIIFEGRTVGKLVEGKPQELEGKKVDEDGDILDKHGNAVGRAERWTEPDSPEPEVIDMSELAGKKVNKLGNIVDSNGQIFGRLIEGEASKLVGKMCNKDGSVMNEMGEVVGKAVLAPVSEREGEKSGSFSDFDSPKVVKDGKISDANSAIIGRLIEGDAKKLLGKPVDTDGDILDKNGNTIGKAERWEEEEKEVSKHPAAGRRLNREGNALDENGDVIAKLTEGEVSKCAGKEIDNDGDIVDQKGNLLGHVTRLESIPEPAVEEPLVEEPLVEEPEESEEEIEKRKQAVQDRKLAGQLASCIQQSMDKTKPILKMITDAIDAAERQPKEELDEQKLVDTVKPLLEEGGQVLQECNGAIRALDPDGRIQTNAKHKATSREASPEEYHLAEQLKDMTGSVVTTIDNAKKKIAGMPHAKKELNPLWSLLAEPLGQIIAAVGLLLSGVLGLVGRLLSGLGLGGLLDNLLGGLGIKGILNGLGLGMVTKSLTGKK